MLADIELRRFFAYQEAEARRLWYPRMSVFSKDIAKGTLAPAPVAEDPIMDVVGAFYGTLREIDKRVLAEHYAGTGSRKDKADAVGISIPQFRTTVDRLCERCAGYMMGRGVISRQEDRECTASAACSS